MNNFFIIHKSNNLKIASKNCYQELKKYLKNNDSIFISGGKSLDFFLKYLLKLSIKKIYLTDERLTKIENKSNYHSLKKKINKNIIPYYEYFKKNSLSQLVKKIPNKPDIIVMGIGNDGHIASIFPQKKNINLKKKLIITKINSESFSRLSISMNYILKSKVIFLIISNKKKLDLIFSKKNDLPVNYLIKKFNGVLKIFY